MKSGILGFKQFGARPDGGAQPTQVSSWLNALTLHFLQLQYPSVFGYKFVGSIRPMNVPYKWGYQPPAAREVVGGFACLHKQDRHEVTIV